MVFDEALEMVLMNGTRVRGVKWPKGSYIHLDSFNQAVYNNGKYYLPCRADITQSWEEYSELGVGSKLRKGDAYFIVIQESPSFVSIVNTDDWAVVNKNIETNELAFFVDSLGFTLVK